jgi:hypothetical protein
MTVVVMMITTRTLMTKMTVKKMMMGFYAHLFVSFDKVFLLLTMSMVPSSFTFQGGGRRCSGTS